METSFKQLGIILAVLDDWRKALFKHERILQAYYTES